MEENRILGSVLYLYSRDRPAVWGCGGEFISSGRLDDQQCVFAALRGFLRGKSPRSINVLACFDNEEVGSGTRQGAASPFLRDVLRRISLALGRGEEDYLRALASSFMLSGAALLYFLTFRFGEGSDLLAVAAGLLMGGACALFFVMGLSGTVGEGLAWVADLSPFALFDPYGLAAGQGDAVAGAVALAVAAAALFAAAIACFCRRDFSL